MFKKIKYNFIQKHLRVTDGAIFQYDFLMSLQEKNYRKFLEDAYFLKKGKILNLKKVRTLNEKIQWLKLYDNFPLKSFLTDKVEVRSWISEKIGKEYLKPVLQICKSWDSIDFRILPEKFVIKCNHGCKWQFIILNKEALLKRRDFYNLVETNIKGWLSQSFFGWSDFETQYKNIKPQIIIEEYLKDNKYDEILEFCIYCFNSNPKIFEVIKNTNIKSYCFFDENYNTLPITINNIGIYKECKVPDILKKAVDLSRVLCKNFKLVRVDWYIYKEKLYFNEMTFTPFSGYIPFTDEKFDIELGNLLNLKDK